MQCRPVFQSWDFRIWLSSVLILANVHLRCFCLLGQVLAYSYHYAINAGYCLFCHKPLAYYLLIKWRDDLISSSSSIFDKTCKVLFCCAIWHYWPYEKRVSLQQHVPPFHCTVCTAELWLASFNVTLHIGICVVCHIFTSRRVCIVRTMPSQDVCPSVCLSHTGIVSKQLYISSTFFHCQIAPPLQFFHAKRDGNIPTGTPLTMALNVRGYEKITIVDQYLALSRKWCNCKIEPLLQWKANRKRHPSFRMVQAWMTLSDL